MKYYYGYSVHNATRVGSDYKHVRVSIHQRNQPPIWRPDDKLSYRHPMLSITWQSDGDNRNAWYGASFEMNEIATKEVDDAARVLNLIKRVEKRAAKIERKNDIHYHSERYYLHHMSPMKFVSTLNAMKLTYLVHDMRLWEDVPYDDVMPPDINVYVAPGSDNTAMHWAHARTLTEARELTEQWLIEQQGKRRVFGPTTYEEELEVWLRNNKPVYLKPDGDVAPSMLSGLEKIKEIGK